MSGVNITVWMNVSSNSTMQPTVNYEEELCQTVLVSVRGFTALVLCVVGVVGNILSLAVLSYIGRTSVTFFLLKMLAIVNTCYLTMYMMAASIPQIVFYYSVSYHTGYWVYVVWMLFPIASMALTATVWTTTLVTVHRYLAVCRMSQLVSPVSHSQVYIQVVVMGLLAVMVDLPKYWETRPVTTTLDNYTYHNIQTTPLWSNWYYQMIYKNVLMIAMRKLIPICVVVLFTYRLVRILMLRKQYRIKVLHRPRQHNEDIVTTVLVVVAVVFMVCHIPMAIYPILRIVMTVSTYSCHTTYMYLATSADVMALLNSAVNFIIYYPFIPMFRSTLKHMVCGSRQDCHDIEGENTSLTATPVKMTKYNDTQQYNTDLCENTPLNTPAVKVIR